MPATTMTSRISDADEIVVTETTTKVVSKIVDYNDLVEKIEAVSVYDGDDWDDWDEDLDNSGFYGYGLTKNEADGYAGLPHEDMQGTRACSSYVNRDIGVVYFTGFNAFARAYRKYYRHLSKHDSYVAARECGISAAEDAVQLLEDQYASALYVSLEFDTGADVVRDGIGSGGVIRSSRQTREVEMLAKEYVLPEVISQLEDLDYTVINQPLPFKLDIKAKAHAYAVNHGKEISRDVLDKFFATRKEK